MSVTSQDAGQEGLVDQAKSGVSGVASEVQDKAAELKDQGRGKLGQTLDRRTTEIGGQAREAAQTLRDSGTQMSQEGSGNQQVVHLTQMAADQVERLGGYLERVSGDELLRDAEQFARRRPWMVAGIGLIVGLAASRFLKASSERRYESSSMSGVGRYSYSSARPAAGGSYEATTRGGSYGTTTPGGSYGTTTPGGSYEATTPGGGGMVG